MGKHSLGFIRKDETAFPWIAFASFYIITWIIIKVFYSLASFGPIWANSLKAVLP